MNLSILRAEEPPMVVLPYVIVRSCVYGTLVPESLLHAVEDVFPEDRRGLVALETVERGLHVSLCVDETLFRPEHQIRHLPGDARAVHRPILSGRDGPEVARDAVLELREREGHVLHLLAKRLEYRTVADVRNASRRRQPDVCRLCERARHRVDESRRAKILRRRINGRETRGETCSAAHHRLT